MASVGPTDVPEIHTSEEPSVDVFGPPHDHTISESLQLWIFVPGLISLILLICELLRVLLSFLTFAGEKQPATPDLAVISLA